MAIRNRKATIRFVIIAFCFVSIYIMTKDKDRSNNGIKYNTNKKVHVKNLKTEEQKHQSTKVIEKRLIKDKTKKKEEQLKSISLNHTKIKEDEEAQRKALIAETSRKALIVKQQKQKAFKLIEEQLIKDRDDKEKQLKENLFNELIELQRQGYEKFPDDNLTPGPRNWTDPWYCDIKCEPRTPCQYKDEVDFRIIVMTYNRNESLKKTLNSILNLETLGDKISVDIWIDRSTTGIVDKRTVSVAKEFVDAWTNKLAKGRACYHLRGKNAYATGQWVDSWRPRLNTNETALILEDDIDISRFAYKWIKPVHQYFKSDNDIMGYTLQMENTNFFAPITEKMKPLKADKNQTVFLYPVYGAWGFIPCAKHWRQFQDWFHTARHKGNNILTDFIKPHVPGIINTHWYNVYLENGIQESMWEIWLIKYMHDYRKFTVYNNMKEVLGKQNIQLSHNRKEQGLHYSGKEVDDVSSSLLLEYWDEAFVKFPPKSKLVKYNYNSDLCTDTCCFAVSCNYNVENDLNNSTSTAISS